MEHAGITSAIFDLIETFEFDMSLGADSWATRVELYQASSRPTLFRCHVWQAETYRIQPTFPQRGGEPTHEASDELVLVEYSDYLRGSWDPTRFEASSPSAARQMIEQALLAFLRHSADVPA